VNTKTKNSFVKRGFDWDRMPLVIGNK